MGPCWGSPARPGSAGPAFEEVVVEREVIKEVPVEVVVEKEVVNEVEVVGERQVAKQADAGRPGASLGGRW